MSDERPGSVCHLEQAFASLYVNTRTAQSVSLDVLGENPPKTPNEALEDVVRITQALLFQIRAVVDELISRGVVTESDMVEAAAVVARHANELTSRSFQ